MIYELDTAHDLRFKAKLCDRWCYFGGSSKSDTHQVSSNTINPAQMAQYQQNYAGAQQRVDSLTPYTGPITAGFNPTQIQSQGILSGIANDPRYAATNATAIDSAKGILGYTPQTYDAAQLSNTDLTPYLNPYQKQVIDASVAQNQYARDQQGVADNASATAANAFGGTRQAVQRANTTAAYDRNNQQNLAALNSANFSQAQQAALADIAAKNNASQFNSNQSLAGQQLRLNAAGQIVGMNAADLARAAQQGGILSAVGDTQQAQQQKEFTDAYNAYLQGQQLTLAQQQVLNQALGIIPIEQTNTTDGTTTTKSNPGIGGVLGAVGSLGLAAATGGTSLGLTGALGGLLGSSLRGQSSGPMYGYT